MEEIISIIRSVLPSLGERVGIPADVGKLAIDIAEQAVRSAAGQEDPVQALRDTLTRMIQEDLDRTH